ncbi:MAG TPA: UbiA family prenyltransferase [Chitinophagales bacterium]|nr:UbiA family prenyltransferase [Chitinophagales bacterium]
MIKLPRVLQEVVDFVFFGNFIITACTVGLLWTTYYYAGIDIRFDMLTLFVAAATFFQYNLHRLITTRKHKGDAHPAVVWSRKHPFVLTMLCLVSGGAAAILFFPLTRYVINALVPLVLMSVLYEIPLINVDGKRVKLRNIWFFKTILLVLTWTFATVLLPYLQYDLSIYTTEFALLFVKRLLLILALAVLFDIRDFDYDRADGVRTIPVMFGIMRSRRIILSLFVLVGLVGMAQVVLSSGMGWPHLFAVAAFPALSYYIAVQGIRQPTDYFYALFVDGIMALELVFLFLTGYVMPVH